MPFMSYELAVELKTAGFPQSSSSATCYYTDRERVIVVYPEAAGSLKACAVRVPTLSELVRACGPHITSMIRKPDGWSADEERGDTLIEAVARRWLALQSQHAVR